MLLREREKDVEKHKKASTKKFPNYCRSTNEIELKKEKKRKKFEDENDEAAILILLNGWEKKKHI